jgi:hypothetical protein
MPLYTEYPQRNYDTDVVLRSTTTTKDKLAQSFKISAPASVSRVRLYLKKTGAPVGALTLRIETDSAGDPSGVLVDSVATTTFSEASLTTSYALIDFNYTRFDLVSDTTYWMVLSTDRAASPTDTVEWGADSTGPAYADGEMKSEQAAAWVTESADAIFSVLTPAVNTRTVYRIASGWDVPLNDMLLVEDSFPLYDGQTLKVSGRGTYDAGIVRVRGDQLTTITGIEAVTWNIPILSINQYTHWQRFYSRGGQGLSGKVTIYTPIEDVSFSGGGLDNFVQINAIFFIPKQVEIERLQKTYQGAPVRFVIEGLSA